MKILFTALVMLLSRFSGFACVSTSFTPIPRHAYRVGAPAPGYYRELLNSDAGVYGGSNLGNAGGAWAEAADPHASQAATAAITARLKGKRIGIDVTGARMRGTRVPVSKRDWCLAHLPFSPRW